MAGQIPQHFIDDLLARVDVVDVVNERVTLKKSGSNYSACCPFHNEKTPSFTVSQTKQFYHCFGCNANGNAIGFLMAYDNMHFVDAIETLAESIGLEVPRDELANKTHADSKPLYVLLESVAKLYQNTLRDAPEAVAYLKNRGLGGDIAKRFGIGFVPDGWDTLATAFPKDEKALLKTGMLKRGDSGRIYQRFRNRIMFPIRDRRGRTIAFGGRVLNNDEPKYLNSPETPLFHKGSELYGLFEARKAAQDADMVIVVEGYMDVVALAQHGIDNAVATLGTAANQQHSETLFRVVSNIVFCFDGDSAGRSAAWRALTATLPCLQDGRDAQFLFLPDGEDPDSIVSDQGLAGFQKLLAKRQSIVEFLYNHLAENLDIDSIGGKAQLAEKSRPLLASIPKGVYKQLAIQHLEKLIGLPMGSRQASAPRKPRFQPRSDTGTSTMSRAVLLILQHPGIVNKLPPDAYEYDTSSRGADTLTRLIAYCDSEPEITTARLLERFRDTANHAYLIKLATKFYWPDGRDLDFDTALTEFNHVVVTLQKQSKKTGVSKVDKSMRTGLLSIPRTK